MPYDRAVRRPPLGSLVRDDGTMGRSLAIVVLAGAWVATWRPQVDPDAWWHLAVGSSIVSTGAIPATDPFSWLTAGQPFVAHSWLWDLFLLGAWRTAGPTGTSLLVLPVTAAIVWLVWTLLGLAAPTMPRLGRATLVLVAVIVALPVWAPRAQTLDVAFVLATVLVLARYLLFNARRGLLALPFLGVLWANLHGSAILALPACVALAVVALPIGVRLGAWPRRAAGPLVVAGLAGLAATVLNPYGAGLLAYPFDRDVASAFTAAIVEWRPPDFGAAELVPFRVLLAGLLLVAIWHPVRPRDPFLFVAAAAWTFAALGSVRFLAMAAPLLVIALAPAIGTAISGWIGPSADPTAADPTTAPGPATRDVRRPAVGLAALAVAGILAAGWFFVDPARQDAAIERRLPVAAVAALEAADCTARLLPAYGWAGYVIWSSGRAVGAYGNSAERAVTDQARLEALAIDPGPWLDDHAVGAVLMPADGPLSQWLDAAEGWRPAYRDGQATIHVRVDATDCPISPPSASKAKP